MFAIIVGGGKVGANVIRTLVAGDSEAVIIEASPAKAAALEEQFGSRVVNGDGTEMYVLERAGIARPPEIVVAVTGDDEDNLIISQLARERYGVKKTIARVNDPRNQEYFDLLGVAPTVCPAERIMALIEHEVPQHDVVQLLKLKAENLEIVEVEVGAKAPSVGTPVDRLELPDGARLISVVRDGRARVGLAATEIRPGDQLLVVLEAGGRDALRKVLLGR